MTLFPASSGAIVLAWISVILVMFLACSRWLVNAETPFAAQSVSISDLGRLFMFI